MATDNPSYEPTPFTKWENTWVLLCMHVTNYMQHWIVACQQQRALQYYNSTHIRCPSGHLVPLPCVKHCRVRRRLITTSQG
jgi:hypothetical protein